MDIFARNFSLRKGQFLLSIDGRTISTRIDYTRHKNVTSLEFEGVQCHFQLASVTAYNNWTVESGTGALALIHNTFREDFRVHVECGKISCIDDQGEERIRSVLYQPEETPDVGMVIGMISDGKGSELRLITTAFFWKKVRKFLWVFGGNPIAVANEQFARFPLNIGFLMAVYEITNRLTSASSYLG
jgi:hypothetical protein